MCVGGPHVCRWPCSARACVQVRHLADLPAPDAYHIADLRSSIGLRMVPPSSASASPRNDGANTPGPGTYMPPAPGVSSQQASGRRASITGMGYNCTELDRAITLARTRPGPGQYDAVRPPLRGTPRFCPEKKDNSFIAQVMAQSVHSPGPGAYAPTLTVREELDDARRVARLAS